jgi:hypothetical protein
MKKEADGEHPAGHYLVVDDAEKVDSWHLRVKGLDGKPDHGLMGAAWAALHEGYRGSRYEGPGKAEALARLKDLYKVEKVPMPGGAKAGMRNNIQDRATVREIRGHAGAIHGLTMGLEPTNSDNEMGDWTQPAKAVGAHEQETMQMHIGVEGAVKAIAGRMSLDVLGVPFGGPFNGKDEQGDYFSPRTKIYAEKFPHPLTIYFHGWDLQGRPSGDPVEIGNASYSHVDTQGHWYRVDLYPEVPQAQQVYKASLAGKARASSGSIAHLVRGDKKTGEIRVWPVAELTLVELEGGRRAVNPYAVAMPSLKAAYDRAGMVLPVVGDGDNPEAAEAGTPGDGQGTVTTATSVGIGSTEIASAENHPPRNDVPKVAEAGGDPPRNDVHRVNDVNSKKGVKEMDENDVKKLMADALAGERVRIEAEAKVKADEQVKVDAAVKAAKDAAKVELDAAKAEWVAEAAKAKRLPWTPGAPAVAQYGDTWKYDHLEPSSLALVIDILSTAQKMQMPSGVRVDAVPQAMMKALALKCMALKDEDGYYVKSAMKASGLEPNEAAIKEAFKAATDPMYTAGSGYGSDWVGTAYSNDIWRMIRAKQLIVSKLPSEVIPDGYSSKYWPVESVDPTWYAVPEAATMDATLKIPAATITSSQATTAVKQINLGKMGVRVMYTGELVEDSLVPFADQLREQLVKSGSDQVEHLVIDGDTETAATTNINCIGGTPVLGTLYLLQNGFRKLALITNTANARSAAGSLSIQDFVETLWLMGPAGLAAADPSNVAFIIDPNVLKAASLLPEVLTKDVSSVATLENGWITKIWGLPVLPSWFMHWKSVTNPRKANTAGKVDTTTQANNTTGAILGVRFDQWKLAYKRRMSIELTRIANADSYEIVGLLRLGLGYRDTEASAISYNVGV